MTTRHDDYLWNPHAEPVADIAALERALAGYRAKQRPFAARRHRLAPLRWAVHAAAAVLLTVGAHTVWLNRPMAAWTIHPEQGGVFIDGEPAVRGVRIAAGNVLASDSAGRVRVAVGRIGDVYMSPGSELELVDGGEAAHRFALRRGELHARIWAPPRFFVVDTRWGSAVDLGCIYTLRVDADGTGTLEVFHGSVELVAQSGRVHVAAGTGATIGESGPGVPWPLRSTAAFRAAAAALAAGVGGSTQVATLLADADPQVTVTLWHLLPRVPASIRAALIDRLANHVTDMTGADRAALAALEPVALAEWEAALRPLWSPKGESRWWRNVLVRWRLAKPIAFLQLQERTD